MDNRMSFRLRSVYGRGLITTVYAFFLALSLFISSATAGRHEDDISVSASIQPSQLYIGDSAELDIVVNGTVKGDIDATIPDVPGLAFSGPSIQKSSSTNIINGRISTRKTITLSYTVQTSGSGQFTVPPIEVSVNKKKYTTQSITFRVSKPPSDESMMLKTVLSDTECREGEGLVVSYIWYIANDQVEGYTYSIPLLARKDELELKVLTPDRSILSGKVIGDPTGKQTRLEISGYEVPARTFTVNIDGVDYIAYAVTFRIFPPNPGMETLGAASVKAKIIHSTKIVTDDFWGMRRRVPEYRMLYAYSDPVRINVLPLPDTNVPADFTGAVGVFNISVKPDITVAKVGDPIRLEITISGTGLLSRVKRPILSEQTAFDEFQVTDNLEPGEIDDKAGKVVFEQVVRPRNDRIASIPPVKFSFFNPQKGVYETITSKPIPIKVLATKVITAEDVIGGSPITGKSVEKLRVRERKGVIRANYTHEDILKNQGLFDLRVSLLIILACPLLYFVTVLAVEHRRRLKGNKRLSRQKRALKAANKLLAAATDSSKSGKEKEFFDHIASALRGYISDMLDLGHGELTVSDISELQKKGLISKETANSVSSVLEKCDMGRFGGAESTESDRKKILADTREAISALRKEVS